MEGKGKGRSYLLSLEGIRELFEALKDGYIVLAPKLRDGLIALSEVQSLEELPLGYRNIEAPGFCVIEKVEGYFTYTHPYNSFKSFLHPTELPLIRVRKEREDLNFQTLVPEEKAMCLFDIRACDLSALKVLDTVFLYKNPHPDPYYASLREGLFVLAVNCSYATSTCFCTTMETGPEVKEGYDLLITELSEGFLTEVGSEKGKRIIEKVKDKREAEGKHFEEKRKILEKTELTMKRAFQTEGLTKRLYERMDAKYWEHIEKRCVACTSCTQACPTCFCFDIIERNNLELEESLRVRVWDSCFSPSFATVHRFNLRQSVHSRYRQWLMHKFAYWVGQFDCFGCVGCGRCITWCPVGIDIREEVRRIAYA
ncbi:4Fe-4S dicluster domain-containing protein [Hydrogenobacter sp. T-2]|uniref:4Fe-4S dicluster domain-containing protein n=1 Tax=Pampinifervens diazotrophicum TaxID=1632018 RepID=UPI002B263C77|nr:4Fe-4S dicluster domain-containing protein [Hydrogenobacter sp. T-2]WPM32043.1 4Fe-4S dicluster domain-containing protein [Hydrogenobacter sp. T-2]